MFNSQLHLFTFFNTMIAQSIPDFIRTLNALSGILEKGAASAQARKIDPLVLTSARLAPDMFPLKKQVQIACDVGKLGFARLSGTEAPKFADPNPRLKNCKRALPKQSTTYAL